ncbi:hypothetical protein O3P69_005346 [Scylla paramamosain]|uniref:Vesicle transport protein USE1 n=1 Tax=Scylla paramamosain TaxID=85552 RepID=A0AAW0UB99_SCYPA
MEAPVSRSRLEINFMRLLDETQQMANGSKPKDWTFEKYIEWLQKKIPEMEKSPNAPNEETLKHYRRQVDFLRSVLETEKCPEALESVAASQLIPHGTATTSQHTLTQQIHQRTKTTTTNRLRQDLLNLGQGRGGLWTKRRRRHMTARDIYLHLSLIYEQLSHRHSIALTGPTSLSQVGVVSSNHKFYVTAIAHGRSPSPCVWLSALLIEVIFAT